MRWRTTAALLLVVVVCGAGVRSLRAPDVLRGDTAVFPIGDSYYHLRRADFSLARGGELLLFDPLVNFPDGAWIPWPPLHTLLLTGSAVLAGGSRRGLEIAALWLPVAIGALTALPVYGAARALAGRRLALFAAAIAALLPASIAYSEVGNVDHHCTVSFFGAVWLWGALRALRDGPGRGAQALVALGRLGVVFTWPGSLLYLLIGDASLVGVAILRGRARALRDAAFGLGICAALVLLLVPQLGPPLGGSYSTIALSYLHPAALAALAAVAAACSGLERLRPDRGVPERLARAALVAGAIGAALLALPGLLDSLREVAGFLGKDDPWAAYNAEQRPVFDAERPNSWLRPLWYYGGFGYGIPLLPLVLLARARDPRHRDATIVLALWTAGFGLLAATQIRYGSDYAPAASVGFALATDSIGRWIGGARRARLATAAVALLGAGPLVAQQGLQAVALVRGLRAEPPRGDPLLASPTGTLYRFAEEIRRVTPPTDGYLDPLARPAYGILCPANVGHLLHYVAQRATPADNFGPYAGSRHFRAVQRFFDLTEESGAVRIADRLGARYVLTLEYGPVVDASVMQRLHREDGLDAPERPRWEFFRLITEGPPGGRPLAEIYGGSGRPGVAPYKLFERVAGAELAVPVGAGGYAEAEALVRTPIGREFRYLAYAFADGDGVARMRVPYATGSATPTRVVGAWRVRVGEVVEFDVEVPEAAVLGGGTVRADPPGPPATR